MKIHTPAMTFKSTEAEQQWQQGLAKNSDPYGRAVYRYASEWATRMEAAIAAGGKIKDIAKPTSHEADDEGITGFMYGCAVTVLSNAWIHDEALRLWHNRDTQIGTEGDEANDKGGVLNPAVLRVGQK